MSKLKVRVAYISFSVFILFDKTHRDPSLAVLYCSGKHSRQSAKLFLQSSELGIPTPSPAGEGAPPPPRYWGEGPHFLAREGGGRAQFRRGDIHLNPHECRPLLRSTGQYALSQ
jgi:hypothetical protein